MRNFIQQNEITKKFIHHHKYKNVEMQTLQDKQTHRGQNKIHCFKYEICCIITVASYSL